MSDDKAESYEELVRACRYSIGDGDIVSSFQLLCLVVVGSVVVDAVTITV